VAFTTMAAGGPAPAPGPGLRAVMEAGLVTSTRTPRSKPMLVKTFLGSLAAKVAVGVGLATAGVTAASAAGVLPAAAQHAVATVVGATTPFQLSDPTPAPAPVERRESDDGAGSATTSTSTTSTSIRRTTTTSVSPTTTVTTDDGRKDNHGSCVSNVAHDQAQAGEDHGKTVSSVARSDCGKDSTSSSSTTVKPSTTTSTSTTVARTSSDKGKGKGGKDE